MQSTFCQHLQRRRPSPGRHPMHPHLSLRFPKSSPGLPDTAPPPTPPTPQFQAQPDHGLLRTSGFDPVPHLGDCGPQRWTSRRHPRLNRSQRCGPSATHPAQHTLAPRRDPPRQKSGMSTKFCYSLLFSFLPGWCETSVLPAPPTSSGLGNWPPTRGHLSCTL